MSKNSMVFGFFLLGVISTHLVNARVIPVKVTDSVALEIINVGSNHTVDIPILETCQDMSAFMGISAMLFNPGDETIRVEGFLNGNRWVNTSVLLDPGEISEMKILFKRSNRSGLSSFPGMNGMPGGTVSFIPNNPKNIEKVSFRVFASNKASLKIFDVGVFGTFFEPELVASRTGFFPMIDKFGQYKHADWSGKVKHANELAQAAKEEALLLEKLTGPLGRNRFGGYEAGPQLKTTGYFRTEKVNGKWWLVDPLGKLFWSHGLTCIGFDNAATSIKGRSHFFSELPHQNGIFNEAYTIRREETTVSFAKINLQRKYGDNWSEIASSHILKRLKSWGINSFGNWSDPQIFLSKENRIPYTMSIGYRSPKIDGESAKFPDVFNPEFRASLKTSIANVAETIKSDSFCIGFFIDNELKFDALTKKLMQQPVESKSRLKFIVFLKSRYSSILKLNQSWETDYLNWEVLESLTELPDGSETDTKAFDLEIIDTYYSICREEIKRVIPNKIYFGSRITFHYYPDEQEDNEIIKLAAEYTDVLCFNRYRFTAEDLILPFGIDKPTLIGEFHFGALDRGLPHTGLRSVSSQDERAEAYESFVSGALNNPQIVGTHWFQYSDQAFTGRFDGENFQIGFVDICDNPYSEIINAARKIGYGMYRIRLQ